MKIPFWVWPGHWGLKGKTREIARAEYELQGYELDVKIANITHEGDSENLDLALLKAKKKHGQLSEYDYQMSVAERNLTGVDLDLKKLDIDFKLGKIDEQQFAKTMATIKGEPYVAVINSTYDPKLRLEGFEFEFDWNHLWIEQLIANGYTGASEELIVQRWFEDLCRTVVIENADQEPMPFNSRRVANRVVRDNGSTDYL